jgi:beta-N-acetylhexosaminidase
MVLVSHANYSEVTRDGLPASLSKKWITDILRRRIAYRGLIVSDDLEMGGVLKAAPVGEAAARFIDAGGDLALVCHEQKNVEAAYDALVHEAEKSAAFRRRMSESVRRIAAFKRRSSALKVRSSPPSPEKMARLSTQLWEFGERVRLSAMRAGAAAGKSS